MKLAIRIKGGKGSGHRGHAGRPGKRGGSLPGKGKPIKGVAKPRKRAATYGPGNVKGIGKDMLKGSKVAESTTLTDDMMNVGLSSLGWLEASGLERSEVKASIMEDISKRSGVSEETVNEIMASWAETSNDANIEALSLQQAAVEEFGLELSEWQKSKVEGFASNIPGGAFASRITSRENERKILRAMYENTQEHLAKFVDLDGTITLYRGLRPVSEAQKGDTISYLGNAIESWSSDEGIASVFAESSGKMAVMMNVPVKNIFSTARTGLGALIEAEFVIFGNIPRSIAKVTFMAEAVGKLRGPTKAFSDVDKILAYTFPSEEAAIAWYSTPPGSKIHPALKNKE